MTNPLSMVEVGVAWRDHTWQIMEVWISSSTPEDKIAETAIAAALDGDNGSIAGAWLAHYTHEDFLFAQEEDAPASPYMTDEEYIAANGCRCPVCQSDDIEGGETDISGRSATQEVSCLNCESTWVDVYKLIGYDCLNDNSPDPEDTDDES